MTLELVLFEQDFVAMNGGPHFKLSPALSFLIPCDTRDEIDRHWNALSDGGDPKAQQCGWLKDKFGVPWQIVPRALGQLLGSPDRERSARTMKAMLQAADGA